MYHAGTTSPLGTERGVSNMSNKDLVVNKIKLAVVNAELNAMLFMKNKISGQEMDERAEKLIEEVYSYVSGFEPKNESEAI